MTDKQTTESRPSVDPEFLREQLRRDDNALELAKNLGVEIEDYIDQVLYYALNPEADPEMTLIADEDIEIAIGEASEAFDKRLAEWFAGVADGTVSLADALQGIKDEFGVDVGRTRVDAARAKWSGAEVSRTAPEVGKSEGKILGDKETNQVLRGQLLSQRMSHSFRQRAVQPSVAGGGKAR